MSLNTILAKSTGHREEKVASGILKPGHLLLIDSANQVAKHAVVGGRVPVVIATEDALQGKTVADAYAVGDRVSLVHGVPGDKLVVRLQSGQNAVEGSGLVSGGDGTFTVGETGAVTSPGILYRSVAASTAVSNTTVETLFDKFYTLPANAVLPGDVLVVKAQVIATATNSTDTLNIKLYIGGLLGTAICATGALDVANNDIAVIDATITIRTIGATGTFVATGSTAIGASGTATRKVFNLGSTAIDTTTSKVIGVSATWSVTNAGNSARLDVLTVELERVGGKSLMYACEAKDATSAEQLIIARVG